MTGRHTNLHETVLSEIAKDIKNKISEYAKEYYNQSINIEHLAQDIHNRNIIRSHIGAMTNETIIKRMVMESTKMTKLQTKWQKTIIKYMEQMHEQSEISDT